MRCPNCKKLIINPVEHEYCVFKSKPAPRIIKITGPVIQPDDYKAPKVQGRLNHQMAKPGERPRKHLADGFLRFNWGNNIDE